MTLQLPVIQPRFQDLALEIMLSIMDKNLNIEDLGSLRKVCRKHRVEVDVFVAGELLRLNAQSPSTLSDFLATQEPVKSHNAWTILALFKKTYPSLLLNMSIENAFQDWNRQLDQATIALKNALVLQNGQAFEDLVWQQTAQLIRNWFCNPINQPLLQNVTELDLSFRRLSVIPSELCFLSNLEVLNLNRNQLTAIDPHTFGNLQNLQKLYLANNQLTVIHPQTFGNLPNLSWLYLNQNQLTAIDPETFSNLLNLQSLFLNQNQISTIAPQTFANLQNLQLLYLGNNQIPAPDRINHAYLGLRPAATVHVGNQQILLENPVSNLNCSIL